MIKVVHIIDGLGRAGMEQMVYSLVGRINKSRFHVILLSELPMKESDREIVAQLNQGGVEVIFLQKGKARKFLAMEYVKLFRSIRPQIFHSHSGVWRDCCLGAKMAGVPHLFHTEHGRVFLEDNPRTRWTHKFLTHFRDKIVAVSEDLKGFMISAGIPERKLVTIHNGIDVSRFVPGKNDNGLRNQFGMKEKDLIIIAVGRVHPIKDYETLVRAISKVSGEFNKSGFKLFIVGHETADHLSSGGTAEGLRQLCRKLGIEDRVIFLGQRVDVPILLAQADIFVQTSLTEGLSMAILEAKSCGLPVVATDVGGNKEVVVQGETGFLVEKQNVLSVAQALKELLSDGKLRERMGINGRKRVVDDFSLDAMTHRYEEMYLSVPLQP